MKDPYEVIVSLLRTEKGSSLLLLNKYLFEVNRSVNKLQIKKAIEEIYKVKVKSVNVLMVRGKKRRLRYKTGKTPDWKKAVVTLKEGEKIEVT